MKVVIIAQYIFPFITPRSQRATELAKEFARQNHEVVLYAMLGKYDYTKFMNETGIVVKNLGKASMGLQDSDGKRKRTLISRAFTYLFKWTLDFPLILLSLKTKRAVLKEKNIDYLITIAHPHSIHLGVAIANLKHKNYKFWTADCGDPFSLNPFFKHPFYFKYLEKWWSRKTDFITVPVSQAIKGYYPEFHFKIRIIPQGFNFNEVEIAEYKQNVPVHFAYSGMIYPGNRDPSLFLDYLCTLKDLNFKFIVFTRNRLIFEKYKYSLCDKLEIHDYLPRLELLKQLSRMDFLVNIRNSSSVQQPSKLIDYYLTQRPILEISSEFTEKQNFMDFLEGKYASQKFAEDINQYNISNVVRAFVDLINE